MPWKVRKFQSIFTSIGNHAAAAGTGQWRTNPLTWDISAAGLKEELGKVMQLTTNATKASLATLATMGVDTQILATLQGGITSTRLILKELSNLVTHTRILTQLWNIIDPS